MTMRLWDVATGEPIGSPLLGHTDWVTSVAFSLDGRYVASGSADKSIRIWSSGNGRAIGTPFFGHKDSIYSVAFSPNGRHLVSGSLDTTIWLWDVSTGKPIWGVDHLQDNPKPFPPQGNRDHAETEFLTQFPWSTTSTSCIVNKSHLQQSSAAPGKTISMITAHPEATPITASNR
jgi:WD40 repeat protein